MNNKFNPLLLEFVKNEEPVQLYMIPYRFDAETEWVPSQVGVAPWFLTYQSASEYAVSLPDYIHSIEFDDLQKLFLVVLSPQESRELQQQYGNEVEFIPLFQHFNAAKRYLNQLQS